VIVPDVAPVPGRTDNEKVALIVPAVTTIIAGTLTAASPERFTVTPLEGAADVSVTVAVLPAPSVTVVSASDRLASAAAAGVGIVGVGGVAGVEEPAHWMVVSNPLSTRIRAISFMTADQSMAMPLHRADELSKYPGGGAAELPSVHGGSRFGAGQRGQGTTL
jgi:hypothetical protein